MAISRSVFKKIQGTGQVKSFDFDYFLQGMNSVTDESVQTLKQAKSFKNFNVSSGVLATGMGVSALKFYSSATGQDTALHTNYDGQVLSIYCCPYTDPVSTTPGDSIVIYTSAKKMYYSLYATNFRTFISLNAPEFELAPDYLYYIMPDRTQVMMFSSNLQPLTILTFTSNYAQMEDAPKIKSLCNHNDRIFAVTANGLSSVWFSDESDPTDWQVSSTGAGNITMNDMLGDCTKIISFKGYVYVFREYGITRISTYASQENFIVQNVYESSNYIYSNTACICGDFILFYATDGFYSFNGVTVKKLDIGFEKLLQGMDQSYAKGVHYKNSYYLMCNTSLSTIATNALNSQNTLIKFDYLMGNYEFLVGCNILDIEKLNSSKIEKLAIVELVSYQNSSTYQTRLSQVEQSGKIYSDNTTKEWISPKVDFGVSNYTKNIYAISLLTKYDCNVIITTEKEEVIVNFAGSNISQKKPVFVSGVMVQIKISTTSANACISHPTLYYKIGTANA